MPADILPLVVTNAHKAPEYLFVQTKGYNDVEAKLPWPSDSMLLDEIYSGPGGTDPLDELKKWRFYARSPISSFAREQWRGMVTYQKEENDQKLCDAYVAGDYKKMQQDQSFDSLGANARVKALDIHDHTLVRILSF